MEITLNERKERLLKDIELYFKSDYDRVSSVLENLTEEDLLIQFIESEEEKIENYKKQYTNKSYENERGTYYADVKEDERIYDTSIEEEDAIVKEALETATKDYIDVNPKEIHDYKEYSNFIKVELIYDEQLGYRVIPNEFGLFHGILKGDTYFVYPSKDLNLNNPSNVDICNELFENNRHNKFVLGDEIELNGVEPIEISMPAKYAMESQINKLTDADILIAEGIAVDDKFKNKRFTEIADPGIKNKVVKGKLKVKSLVREGFTYQEDLILEPINFIEGTLIPVPREKKVEESTIQYREYLDNYYKRFNYEVKYDELGNPIYPHLIKKSEKQVIKTMESFDDKYGFESFINKRYKGIDTSKLDNNVRLVYFKAYKEYLKHLILTNPEELDFIAENLSETEIAIETLEEKSLL